MEELSVIIVFICHDNASTQECLQKLPSSKIIFVGDQSIDSELRNNERVIIARELEHNIESEKKLLTFTAWYLVIKNRLFLDYKNICLFEYDISLDPAFESSIKKITSEDDHDVITFIMDCGHFLFDVNEIVLDDFVNLKGIENPNKYKNNCWFNTTNHCIKREHLQDFVDWYYPDCLIIKERDFKKLSWYHERLFYIYVKHNNLKVVRINGIKHLYKNSHKHFQ